MNPIAELHNLGQSIWLDYISRELLLSGRLESMVAEDRVRGVTSNPTIFEQAISQGELYNEPMRPMAQEQWPPERIFDALVFEDIRQAAGIFLPLYEATNGEDGFVSVEVSPELANDAEGTLREARRLWDGLNRPNIMIKIPATQAGIPAIEQAIFEGLNVNVTLIFSLARYAEVIEAYLGGLEQRMESGLSLDHVASVASFFVSRVDTKVDAMLEDAAAATPARAAALRGRIAIANAKLAYAQFKGAFADERFAALEEHGARVQRPLWASTSTKNPDYPDTYYVDNLIGPRTVNTVPPKTLDAFADHGVVSLTLEQDLADARGHFDTLASMGISIQKVTDELEAEGVASFARSYASVLKTIARRAKSLSKKRAR
jgi:transaldolase